MYLFTRFINMSSCPRGTISRISATRRSHDSPSSFAGMRDRQRRNHSRISVKTSFCATFTPFYATARNRATFKFGLVKPFVSIGSTVARVALTFSHARERKKVLSFALFNPTLFLFFYIYMCEILCYHATDPRNPNNDRRFRGSIANVTECYFCYLIKRKPAGVVL